jgi:hypothetical protein
MAWFCVESSCKREYFDPRSVVSVTESVNWREGKKPAGWMDGYGALVFVAGLGGAIQMVVVMDEQWPAVKAAIGLGDAVVIVKGA